MPTFSLRAFPPPLRLDIEALARLHRDGRFDLLGPAFPPSGRAILVLWRPGERPGFTLHHARIRGERAEPGADAWVVAWASLSGAEEGRDPPCGPDAGFLEAGRAQGGT